MFSLVHAVLLRPLPVRDADRLVSVFTTDARNPGNLPMSHLNYLDLRAQNEVRASRAAAEAVSRSRPPVPPTGFGP